MRAGQSKIRTKRLTWLGAAFAVFAVLAATTADRAGAQTAGACTQDPLELVGRLGDQVIDILTDASLDVATRRTVLADLFRETVDTETSGRLVLGRFWPRASPEQRAEYSQAFAGYIADLYAGQLSALKGTAILIDGSDPVGEADIIVHARFVLESGAPARANFRLRCTEGELKLLDAVVVGVSLLITKRDEFGAFLRNNDISKLIEFLNR